MAPTCKQRYDDHVNLSYLTTPYDQSASYDVDATTHLNQGVTLTSDLQHLTRSSVGASEYSLSVLSKLFKLS